MKMRFDPATGALNPHPSDPEEWRAYHGRVAWLFNPWLGVRRCAEDIGSDVYGHAIVAHSSISSVRQDQDY